ncbi:MAG: hypothetical protein AAFX10_00085 [Pseudomonadota bacterium]
MGKPRPVTTATDYLNGVSPPIRLGLSFLFWLLALGTLAMLGADLIAGALKPFIAMGSRLLLPEQLEIEYVTFTSIANAPLYKLRAVVETPWYFFQHTLPVGTALEVTFPRDQALFHVVLIGAIVFVWPSDGVRQRAYLLLAGCVAIITSTFLDAAVVMAANAHELVYEEFAPARVDAHWLIRSAKFLDHGGRMILAMLLATATVGAIRALMKR